MSVAIITGASSGLGVCYIDAVTKVYPEIEEIWLIARREERLKEVAVKYPDKHCVIIPMDMADMSSFKILEEKLKADNPQIEVLINDAGMSIGSPFEEMELESMLKIIDLNCKGATAVTKVCLPYIIDGGTILEVSSTSAFVPNTNLVVYCALKSLKAVKKGRAVYTTGAFYKCYRLLAKLIPHTLLVKFAGLG